MVSRCFHSLQSLGPCEPVYGQGLCGIANNWSGNWGQYVNDEAEALIKKIPTTTDTAELKDLYTKLTEIYLTDSQLLPDVSSFRVPLRQRVCLDQLPRRR